MTRSELFWAKVDKSGDCWEWQAARDPNGYGRFGVENRKTVLAHRYAVTLDGRDPEGRVVRHSCDNPPCVNPKHLLLGTQQDNVDDAVARGRMVSKRRLDRVDVLILQAMSRQGVPQAVLSERFQISQASVSRYVNGFHRG